MTGPQDPRGIVQRGYDVVSHAYRGDTFEYAGSQYERLLGRALDGVPRRLDLLDLGCGNGVPVSRVLTPSHHVTGVDISRVQLTRARALVPAATFLQGDISRIAFRPMSFDGIVAFYSIIHVPVGDHPGLIRRLAEWLRPGGFMLATVGQTAWTGTEDNWQDVPGGTMYWSHADRDSYLRWLGDAGLLVEWEEFVPEGESGHTALFARRPK